MFQPAIISLLVELIGERTINKVETLATGTPTIPYLYHIRTGTVTNKKKRNRNVYIFNPVFFMDSTVHTVITVSDNQNEWVLVMVQHHKF